MEIYNSIIEPRLNIFDYFPENNICFIDIETTGFSRKYNQIYLIGLVYYHTEENNWQLVQFFANNLNEEKEILSSLNDIISKFDLIITYNGDSFDLPFIKYRMKYYQMKNKISGINTFDIYREIRNNNSYLGLENLKLKTVEKSLGIYREDMYSGKDCIDFYFQYIETRNNDFKNNILKHNYDDLYYLLEIIEIFDMIENIKTVSVNLGKNTIHIQILDIVFSRDVITISCTTTPIDMKVDIIHYDKNFNLKWLNKNFLTIDLNVKEGLITPTKKCLFINKFDLSIDNNLRDLSQYLVPDNLILLKVENKLMVENIKSIIKELVFNIMN